MSIEWEYECAIFWSHLSFAIMSEGTEKASD